MLTLEAYRQQIFNGNMKKLLLVAAFFALCSCSSSLNLTQALGQAEKGNAKAQYQVGWYYANVQNDYSQAIDWLKKSAESYVPAQYYLGWCYYHGYGVSKDLKQAAYWYEKAAQGNDASIKQESEAMLELCKRQL